MEFEGGWVNIRAAKTALRHQADDYVSLAVRYLAKPPNEYRNATLIIPRNDLLSAIQAAAKDSTQLIIHGTAACVIARTTRFQQYDPSTGSSPINVS